MSLVVPNSSEVQFLRYILNIEVPSDLDIKLYVNDFTPAETDTVSNYTEASGSGYLPIQLSSGNWSISPGNPSVAEYPQVEWVFTGALGNVYGYYVVRRSDDFLLWAERFTNGPFPIGTSGDRIRVVPRLTLE